jgi:hypothetical protein
MPKKNSNYSAEEFEQDLQELKNMIESTSEVKETSYHKGGASPDKKRHYVLTELNGKTVDFGTAETSIKSSPSSAARKILKSIAHEKGLFGNNKLKLGSVTFSIRETTQGSKKKIYGPYKGEYQKYTAEELKKAKAEGREYHMKPVIELSKSKKNKVNNKSNNKVNNLKGGSKK